MRNVYHQSPGNPLQAERLPTTRPSTELLPPLSPFDERLGSVAGFFASCFIVVIVCSLLTISPGLNWLEPFHWIVAVVLVVGGIVIAFLTRTPHHLWHPATLCGLALLLLSHRCPWAWQVHGVAAATAFLVYAYGKQASILFTTAPCSRALATDLRANAHLQLIVLCGIVYVLVWGAGNGPGKPCQFALVALAGVAICTPAPRGLKTSRWRIVLDSLLHWCDQDVQPLPGLVQSPLGPVGGRLGLTCLVAGLLAMALIESPESPLPVMLRNMDSQYSAVQQQLHDADWTARLRHLGFVRLLTYGVIVALPMAAPLLLACAGTLPILMDLMAKRDAEETSGATTAVQQIVDDLRGSPDLQERNSVYLGQVVADGSPVLVPREVFREHAHALGDSGSGKTSLFLCPVIEQLVSRGDCSVIVIDLKADSLELLATLQAAAEQTRKRHGISLPLKYFSSQTQRETFAFNPLTQPFWPHLDLLTKTDILCGANGLAYGSDYGSGYYSAANAAILYHTLQTHPGIRSFVEMEDCMGNVLLTAKKKDLNPETRKAGVHVQEVMKRLAACEALNVVPGGSHAEEVVREAIILGDVFTQPQLLYFHLSATLSPIGAPAIARLVTYLLLAAATQTQRQHPVYLVIDEFQRMVASNLEYMLQLARSMGVGIILANQSLADLHSGTTNLIPTVEANCRLRQWFSVSSREDQERLIQGSGVTVDVHESCSFSQNNGGNESVSQSYSETVVPRITINDILLASDHPFRSILRISRGAGYAQYGGMPVIIESQYHITRDEYRRRKSLAWPQLPGAFLPGQVTASSEPTAKSKSKTKAKAKSTSPTWSYEFDGHEAPASKNSNSQQSTEPASAADVLNSFRDLFPEGPTSESWGGAS